MADPREGYVAHSHPDDLTAVHPVTVECGACGLGQTFTVPDDHDGSPVVWECAGVVDGFPCNARNVLDGVEPDGDDGPAAEGAVLVTDGEASAVKDKRG